MCGWQRKVVTNDCEKTNLESKVQAKYSPSCDQLVYGNEDLARLLDKRCLRKRERNTERSGYDARRVEKGECERAAGPETSSSYVYTAKEPLRSNESPEWLSSG
jgi:hypothetical protein